MSSDTTAAAATTTTIVRCKKRLYDEAFNRKKLQSVKVDDFYVEHTVYKVLRALRTESSNTYAIKSAENKNFYYDDYVIRETATSATAYTSQKKATKTELIELFSILSLNDIWFAVYYTQDKDNSWQEKMVEEIQSMDRDNALKFMKKGFTTFGKTMREIVGQKINLKSDNNYYTVRDLKIHFDELSDSCTPSMAEKKSIRKLDVNTD